MAHCDVCGRGLDQPTGAGRPRRYCSAACRQKAYVERLRRSAEPALADARGRLDALEDRLAALDGVVDDLERDRILERQDPEVREALGLLLAAIPRQRR
jgi:hypothetical protein